MRGPAEAVSGRSTWRVIACGAVASAALGFAGAPDGAKAASPAPAVTEALFSMNASDGRLVRAPGGYRLVLNTRGRVAKFSDRPARKAGLLTLSRFTRNWARNGFRADPPNAALVIPGASAARDAFILELRRPRINGRRIVFNARPVGATTPGLSDFGRRADRPRPMRFGPASLFVDGAPVGQLRYVPLTLSVENPPPNSTISLSPVSGSAVFASGPSQASNALFLSGAGGPVPITALSVNPRRGLEIQLGPTSVPSFQVRVMVGLPQGAPLATFTGNVPPGALATVGLSGLNPIVVPDGAPVTIDAP